MQKVKPQPLHTKSSPLESRLVASWRTATPLALATILAILVIYLQTALPTIAIWERSETFAHGFLIFPISLYLIWTQRKKLASIAPQPDLRGLAALFGLGFGWLLADAGSVLIVAQYCLVAMIPVAVWTLLGPQVVRAIAFPLGFLLFAVPNGEFLIPHLMNFTADFVVLALQSTGIPVYREGTFFTIPSGQWSVVEGCSGLRYLIASFTLGTLYAYLTYRSIKRRLIFAALSLVVPLLANWLRAYMIVMIAHLSDMKLALGVDHLIYGWVFFGIVMLLLFWIGAFWREDGEELAKDNFSEHRMQVKEGSSQAFVIASFSIILITAMWPAYAAYLDHRPIKTGDLVIHLPDSNNGWVKQASPLADWEPHYVGTDAKIIHTYKKDDMVVSLYVGYYRTQRQDAELINSQNFMVRQKHPVWSNVGEQIVEITLKNKKTSVQQTFLRAQDMRLLIWNWNHLKGTYTVNPYLSKLLLAKDKLSGQHDDGAVIIIAAPYTETPETAAAWLQAFTNDMLPGVESSLDQVAIHGQ